MQVAVMLIFLAVWLIIFWVGSIALETTGMVRVKARFQALSALTGTGFTTREAESIVNHPGRRRIVTWLIFIGNAGIIAFIILMILYVKAGLTAPSSLHIGIILGIILIIVLLAWLKIIDKLTTSIISLTGKGRAVPDLITEELLYQSGDYGIAHVTLRDKGGAADFTLKDSPFSGVGITVLAIERGDEVIHFPKAEEMVLAGDYLLCYGKVAEILRATR